MPSLVLIDGGLGQLHAAAEALEALEIINQPLASIAKREEIIYVYGQEDEPVVLDHHSPVLHLVQLIRDEAHRFAVTFHRKRRQMRDRPPNCWKFPESANAPRRRLLRAFRQRAGGEAGRFGRPVSGGARATRRTRFSITSASSSGTLCFSGHLSTQPETKIRAAEPSLFGRSFLWIFAIALAVTVPFLFFGIPSGHDLEFHLDSWMEVVSQWKQGVPYPHWAALAHYGYGEARFLFYPPASWLLGAILGVILPWSAVPAAYVVIVLTLCGSSMFLLARRWLPPRDALFAAMFYAANPYHLVIVYWRSAYAELLAAALLPLLLLSAFKGDEEGSSAILPLSLVVTAAWLTNAPAAVMVNYSLVLIALVLSISRRNWRALGIAGIAILLGAALAGFYIFPAAYEQKWVNIEQVLAPGVRPEDNFLFTTITDLDHNRFNLLVSVVAIFEMGILLVTSVFSRKRFASKQNRWWVLVMWGAAATLLMFSITVPGWTYLPKLRFIQLPWRWLLCLNVGLTLLLTVAWPKWAARIGVSLFLIGILLFAAHRIQPPWWDQATDIRQLQQDQKSGKGYEGTDEYVPAGDDPYEIDPQARKATYESAGQAHIHVYQWDAQSKLLSANVTAPGTLVMKLFNFPAWKVQVNSNAVTTTTREVTGQMLIPLQPGQNIIQITFVRTWDRTTGGCVSLAAVILVFLLWRRQNRAEPTMLESRAP